jgi:hypothetical protein
MGGDMEKIHQFDVSNCDIRTQLMWEPWATIPAFKIITLLLARKGKSIYSVRGIGSILGLSKSTVHDSLKLLLEHEYIKQSGGRYYINISIEVSEDGQECPPDRTEVSSPPDKVSGTSDKSVQSTGHNNDKEIIIKNNDKVNVGLPPPEDPDFEKSKFWDLAGAALESPDNPKVQNSNQYMTTGRRPLKKHPIIHLTQSELSRALEIYEEFGVPIDAKKIYQRAFLAIEARLSTYKGEGKRLEAISCFNWLIGWALQDLLKSLKSSTDLKRSQKYLEGANGHARR